MIDRSLPGFGHFGDDDLLVIKPDHPENDIRARTASRLLDQLFQQMMRDAIDFSTFMTESGANSDSDTVNLRVPRKIPLLGTSIGTKLGEVTEEYWTIRSNPNTNYGGFPLFFSAGGDPEADAFRRIVIKTGGEIRIHTTFGDKTPHRHSLGVFSEQASADDVIFPPALSSDEAAASLRSDWIGDLVNSIQAYTGMKPDMSRVN